MKATFINPEDAIAEAIREALEDALPSKGDIMVIKSMGATGERRHRGYSDIAPRP